MKQATSAKRAIRKSNGNNIIKAVNTANSKKDAENSNKPKRSTIRLKATTTPQKKTEAKKSPKSLIDYRGANFRELKDFKAQWFTASFYTLRPLAWFVHFIGKEVFTLSRTGVSGFITVVNTAHANRLEEAQNHGQEFVGAEKGEQLVQEEQERRAALNDGIEGNPYPWNEWGYRRRELITDEEVEAIQPRPLEWFNELIGYTVYTVSLKNYNGPTKIQDEVHAHLLYTAAQERGYRFIQITGLAQHLAREEDAVRTLQRIAEAKQKREADNKQVAPLASSAADEEEDAPATTDPEKLQAPTLAAIDRYLAATGQAFPYANIVAATTYLLSEENENYTMCAATDMEYFISRLKEFFFDPENGQRFYAFSNTKAKDVLNYLNYLENFFIKMQEGPAEAEYDRYIWAERLGRLKRADPEDLVGYAPYYRRKAKEQEAIKQIRNGE